MAKKTSSVPTSTSASSSGSKVKSKPAATTTNDFIDDIFAAPKPKSKTTDSAASASKTKTKSVSTGATTPTTTGEPSKKKKKGKSVAAFIPDETSNGNEGRQRKVETVLDPSMAPPPLPASVVIEKKVKGKSSIKRDREDEEDELFRDSRGDGPRRKTEEGFLIYKEAELKIDPEAGGTPLCPFDCDCCF